MKNLLFSLLLLPLVAFGQDQISANGIDLATLTDVPFIEIYTKQRGQKTLARVSWDEYVSWSNQSEVSVNGTQMEFRSRMEVLNLFARNGFELVAINPIATNEFVQWSIVVKNPHYIPQEE